MAWGASNSDVIKRLKARMVECRTCDYCRLRPKLGDKMQQNDCEKQPLLGYFTDAPRICRHHSRWGFLRSKGVELRG